MYILGQCSPFVALLHSPAAKGSPSVMYKSKSVSVANHTAGKCGCMAAIDAARVRTAYSIGPLAIRGLEDFRYLSGLTGHIIASSCSLNNPSPNRLCSLCLQSIICIGIFPS